MHHRNILTYLLTYLLNTATEIARSLTASATKRRCLRNDLMLCHAKFVSQRRSNSFTSTASS